MSEAADGRARMGAGAVLAIDFGTTSCAATLADGARVIQLQEPGGGVTWPSAVFLDDGLPVVGAAAANRRRLRPAAFRDELKTYLGQTEPIVLGGRPMPVRVLVGLLLQAIRQEAERVHGARIGRCVLTVPAAYGPADLRSAALLAAADSAGLVAPQLLPEPVAAALAPVTGEPLPPGATVLVYDFGGGTFDAALVRLASGDQSHRVLGTAALDDCGGRDLDAAVLADLRSTGGAALTAVLDPGPDAAPGARLTAARDAMEFAELARHLKHRAAAEVAPSDYFRPADLVLELSQHRLRTLAQPLIERTTGCCRELLDTVAPGHVAAVVLVGGSSRLPGLSEHLARTLGLPLRHTEDPQTAVARGAVGWATGGAGLTAWSQAAYPGREPLSWQLPPGRATVLEWRFGVGRRFAPGDVLGRARAANGVIVDLAATEGGTVRAQHADPGAEVRSGDWLLTVERD